MSLLSPLYPPLYGPLGHPLGNEGGRWFDILGAGSTFTRASEASYYTQPPTSDAGASPFLAWASSNVPRIDARDGVPMLLMEGARTNLAWHARDMGHAQWLAGLSLTSTFDGLAGVDGAALADRQQTLSAGFAKYLTNSQLGTPTAGQPYVASMFARRPAGAGADEIHYCIQDNGAGTGTYVNAPSSETWTRYFAKRTIAGIPASVFWVPGEGRTTGGLTARALDHWYDLHQFEGGSVASGSFASSPIRTAGASATRSSDVLSWAAGTWPIALANGGFLVEFRPICTSTELATITGGAFNILGVGAGITDGLRLAVSTGVVRLQTNSNNVSVVNQQVSWGAADQALSIFVRPRAGTVTLSGFTTGDGTYSASGGEFATRWTGLQPTSVLYVGSRSGTSEYAFSRFARNWRLL